MGSGINCHKAVAGSVEVDFIIRKDADKEVRPRSS